LTNGARQAPTRQPRVVITGTAAICAAGKTPEEVWMAATNGRSAIGPIRQWDASRWPCRRAGEITDYQPRKLVPDRKLHKLIRRTDVLGLYAADRAIAAAALAPGEGGSASPHTDVFLERTGVFVGSGSSSYRDQYEFFPLLTSAAGDLKTFGRELATTVNPLWLLTTLPNNVLCHIGIRYGFKGPNACITNHSISGALAVAEAAAALRAGEADRAVVVAHDTPVEPQRLWFFHQLGLASEDTLPPFDAHRSGAVLGEGAAALVLETEQSAHERGAAILGEFLGNACASEAEGLLALREDGDGLARAMSLALAEAAVEPSAVGMIVAHANGTQRSDLSEAAALRSTFGGDIPPVTGFKWIFGHTLAASAALDLVLAVESLRRNEVPGIGTLRAVDPQCRGLPVSTASQAPRSPIALVLSRGFGGTNTATLVRSTNQTPLRRKY
jgi:3-oxoacyl-[acyl-carrier-protein] synthase I